MIIPTIKYVENEIFIEWTNRLNGNLILPSRNKFSKDVLSKMDNWSSDESDFTEQIAMIAMMGMQQVVQILRDEEEEEGVVNSQPNTRQRIPRDRVVPTTVW
ncbi:hypothetical protein LXL04_035819 [Taraxacum kok-saghyz]